MTGSDLKQIREDLGHAIGRSLSAADMAKLCGLAPGDGPDTIRKWEVKGPSGPAAELLRILAMASDRYPILENFNVFDRFNIDEKDRPARIAAQRFAIVPNCMGEMHQQRIKPSKVLIPEKLRPDSGSISTSLVTGNCSSINRLGTF